MREVYRNTAPTIYVDLYGFEADTDSVTANLVIGEQEVELDVSLAETDYSTIERWAAVLPLAATAEDRIFTVVWAGTVDASPFTRSEQYNVVTPYAYPESIAERMGWDLENEDDPRYRSLKTIENAERLARFMIDSITGQNFGKRFQKTVSYGAGTDVLSLWDHIINITAVWENGLETWNPDTGVALSGYDYEVTETGRAIRPDLVGVNIDEGGRKYVVDRNAGAFKNGYRYDVEGYFGYESVPSDIEEAAIYLINDYLCADRVWRDKYIDQATVEDWKIRFSELAFRGTGNLTVDKLLENYNQPLIMVI